MSSLLQRLADVALGSTNATLHPMTRLPYQPPPALMPAAADASAPAALQPDGTATAYHAPLSAAATRRVDDTPPPGRTPAPPASAEAQPIAPPISAEPRPIAARPARPQHLETSDAAPQPAPPATPPAPRAHAAPPAERFSISIGMPPRPTARTAAPKPAPAADQAITPPPAIAPRATPPTHPTALRTGAAPARPTAEPSDPSAPTEPALRPLATARPPPAASLLHPINPLRPPLRPQAAAAGPDIHVHIGRVEVTAVHPPTERPRRNPPSQPQPMSLDEYLARRQGKQP